MNRRVIFRVVFFAIIIAAAAGVWMYFKPHPSVMNTEAAFRISAPMLIEVFTEDEARANSVYGGKIVEVEGRLTDIRRSDSTWTLQLGDASQMAGIICYMQKGAPGDYASLRTDTPIRIKGICNGMLLDVVLDNCIVLDGKE